jgi:hypothetical protein
MGFTPRVANTSREISSEATAEPPGESMRRMIAPIRGSARAAVIALTRVSLPASDWPRNGIDFEAPSVMSPST